MMKTRAIMKFLAMLSTVALMFATAGSLHAQSTDTSRDDASATSTSTKDQSDIEKRIKNAGQVLDEIMGVKDKAIPDKIMSDAQCVAVVPSKVKIALGFGGNHGPTRSDRDPATKLGIADRRPGNRSGHAGYEPERHGRSAVQQV